MKFISLFVSLFSATAISACAGSPEPVAPEKMPVTVITESNAMPSPESAPTANNLIRATGIVQYQDLEGGFWGIVADDGRKFDALNLEPEFQKEGLRVRFEATAETDRMSTRMWGTMITLTLIEVVK